MTRRCLPIEAWPTCDRDAWVAAHHRGDLLDDDGLAAHWATATSQIVGSGYGRFLSFLIEIGDLDQFEAPGHRITRPRVEAYVVDLRQQNHASTVAARILQLSRAGQVMAPDVDWKWLRRIHSRLRHMSSPARDDRARLVPAATLSAFWLALIQHAEQAENLSDRSRALLFRDGLMIAVLCLCPIRAKNMAAMAKGTTLQNRGDEWWVAFPSAEMKTEGRTKLPFPRWRSGSIDILTTTILISQPARATRSLPAHFGSVTRGGHSPPSRSGRSSVVEPSVSLAVISTRTSFARWSPPSLPSTTRSMSASPSPCLVMPTIGPQKERTISGGPSMRLGGTIRSCVPSGPTMYDSRHQGRTTTGSSGDGSPN
jgi:hypothetical protein